LHIDEAIRFAREIPDSALEERVMEMRAYLLDHLDHRKIVAEKMKDWCYDRDMCQSLGIDYNHITDRELMKAALCAYYWKYVDRIDR
jgi:hypothetical protein